MRRLSELCKPTPAQPGFGSRQPGPGRPGVGGGRLPGAAMMTRVGRTVRTGPRRRARAGPRGAEPGDLVTAVSSPCPCGSPSRRRCARSRRPHGRGRAGLTPPRPSSAPSGRSPAGAAPHAPPSARSSLDPRDRRATRENVPRADVLAGYVTFSRTDRSGSGWSGDRDRVATPPGRCGRPPAGTRRPGRPGDAPRPVRPTQHRRGSG